MDEPCPITDIRPSISEGERSQSIIDHTDYMSRQNVKLLKENHALKRALGISLRARGITAATYSRDEMSFEPPVTIEFDALENARFSMES